MHARLHPLLLCAGLLGSAAAGFSQAAADPVAALRGQLADPVFRLRASQTGGGKSFAMQAIPAEARQAAHDWLKANAKPQKEQALECRLLAWLARELQRPADEIQKADDLVLQAAPDLPEGWLSRAEAYAASAEKEPENAMWAIDTFAHALRRVDFTAPGWRASLNGVDVAAWLDHAAKQGRLEALCDALLDAFRAAPPGEAHVEAAGFVRSLLSGPVLREHPAETEKFIERLAGAQPQFALAEALAFIELARTWEAAGHTGVSQQLARWLLLAAVPQDIALPDSVTRMAFALQWREAHPAPVLAEGAMPLQQVEHELLLALHEARAQLAVKLRAGWTALQLSWEDTAPRYLPMTQARVLLGQALGDDDIGFVEAALAAAKAQPWNEGIISHALVAAALADELQPDHLALAGGLDVPARSRLALRLCAFAPASRLPLAELAPWLEEGALLMTDAVPTPWLERVEGASALQAMESLDRAGEAPRARRVLEAVMNKPPVVAEVEQWRRLAVLALKLGGPESPAKFIATWRNILSNKEESPLHLQAIAAAAVQGGEERGRPFAVLSQDIWKEHFAQKSGHTMEDAVAAARVAEALLACGEVDGFTAFVKGLRTTQGTYATFARMARELSALEALLRADGSVAPAVDVWVQSPALEGESPRVQWRFVLPELDSNKGRVPPIRLQVPAGPRATAENMTEELTPDARWWAAGTPHALLARLAGKFDLQVMAGESPDKLSAVVRIAEADACGSAEAAELPDAGCLRAVLSARSGSGASAGELRLYSLKPALFTTGREPDAAGVEAQVGPELGKHPSPATWTPHDDDRWGRFIGPPIAIEDGTEYLLTEWPAAASVEPALPVQLILLDERQRPLGVVPLVGTGMQPANSRPPVSYMQHRGRMQRFRASDWGWADDVTCLREKSSSKEEQTTPARYMAFVTRSTRDGALPLLQLRRFREPVSGTGAGLASLSEITQMPELNSEFVAHVGFRVRSWHVTLGPQRGIFTGTGRLAGFDVARIPWKPMMKAESHLITGNEWPLCFASERALVVEPPWTGDRNLGVRLVPFGPDGKNYAACERRDLLPMRNYDRGELSLMRNGAVLMLSSRDREKPEPVAAWLFPDGKCSVCPLPRPPLTGNPGLELAWWGPPDNQFTLHEDGVLFELEVTDELRLVSQRPGSPDDIPEGARPPKFKKKPQWRLERPDILTEHDTKTGVMVRRFHLPQTCEGKPMSFSETSPVFLYTTDHDIIRVNPPPRARKSE